MQSLIFYGTVSPKISNNQDACDRFENSQCGFRGVIIADGIGSHKNSEKASKFCVKDIKSRLERIEDANELQLEDIFVETRNALVDMFKNDPHDEESYSTTLILAIELQNSYKFAYLGNGSIWYCRGSFNTFSNARYIPWNSINLLNPHCVEEGGRSSLTRFITASNQEVSCIPTIIEINKSDLTGEIIIITTDGIYSYDEVSVGKDPDGKVWVSAEENMLLLYESLNVFLKGKADKYTDAQLYICINEFLNDLLAKRLLSDDATIGIIISGKTLKFQADLNSQEENKFLPNEKNNDK